MTLSPDGSLVVVDLSNLCRDRRLLRSGRAADFTLFDRFTSALERSEIRFRKVHAVADRSLVPLLDGPGRRRLREMEQDGSVEFSAVADERILELAFGERAEPTTVVASLDNFDDFRRVYPAIQGSTDRFLEWKPTRSGSLSIGWRDMGMHAHHLMSRKEESAELKARRLARQSLVRRAAQTYFSCTNSSCLLAQLWPSRLPELPRFDDHGDRFVCPSCEQPLSVGADRPPSTQFIVFLHGAEQFRVLLDEGEQVALGRTDTRGCVGLESRMPAGATDAISRTHISLTRAEGTVCVEDLGSRNGTVLRWIDSSHDDLRLLPRRPHVIGRRNTVALPSGVTLEISGRSVPLDGERAPDTGADEPIDRATRILVTTR